MEKKNTILLTVIAVATLLVAVVGATFAYFTATSGATGNGGSTGALNTATVASVGLTAANGGSSTNTVYPGTMNYAGMTVTPTKSGEDDNNYTMTYTVNGSVTLGSEFKAGSVYYTVYRTTSAVGTPVDCQPVAANPAAGGTQYSQTCTLASEFTSGAEIVQERTAVSGTSAPIAIKGETLTTESGTVYYYYLVVEYENKATDQNDDRGKTITASLSNVSITNTAKAGA